MLIEFKGYTIETRNIEFFYQRQVEMNTHELVIGFVSGTKKTFSYQSKTEVELDRSLLRQRITGITK